MNLPKITIITPSYNQGEFLEQTILSVLEQNYANLEYMIFDGGSTDNSVDIIKKYENQLTYWESKEDKGQAHAINKGLKKATGEIFQWLNSDDYLEKDALFRIAEEFENNEISAVAGKTVYFKVHNFEKPIQQTKLSAKGLMNWDNGVHFVQPGVWLRREKIIKCGGIDQNFHYAFDWDMYIRYFNLFQKVSYIDNVLVYFRLHKNSKTSAFIEKFHKEEEEILHKYKFGTNKYLKTVATKRLQRKHMYLKINDILFNKNISKFNRIKKILRLVVFKPKKYLNKISLGAIKNLMK